MLVKTFCELEVYQCAIDLQNHIFELTKSFPKEEQYSLTDQIRRSSRSIGGNIAEAWGKRRYEAHFVSKLTDSDGEQLETQHWLITAKQCGYISDATQHELHNKCARIGQMLGKMMADADRWSTSF
jgi:four helix bundle protein